MKTPACLATLLAVVSAHALTPQEMQQRRQEIVTEIPAMKNQPESFSGLVKHPGLSAST